MLFGPLGRLVEIAIEHSEFLLRAQPIDSQLVLAPRPRSALVREVHRGVVVDRHNEIAICRRQLQFVQVINRVPESRSDNDRARRVLLANDGQRFGQVFVPESRCQLVVRFVEHLEQHTLRRALAMGGELPPEGEELHLVLGGVIAQRIVFVQVENHPQILRLRLADGPIEHLIPGLADRVVVCRIHPPERLQVDAHGVKPRLFKQPEMFGLKPGLVARAPDWIVAEYIHAATQLSVLRDDVCGSLLGVTDRGGERKESGQQEHWPG